MANNILCKSKSKNKDNKLYIIAGIILNLFSKNCMINVCNNQKANRKNNKYISD